MLWNDVSLSIYIYNNHDSNNHNSNNICVYVCECRKAQEYGKAGKLESPWGKHYLVKFLGVTVEYTWHLHVIKNRYHLYIPCESIWCFVIVFIYIYISHMCLIYTYVYIYISIILKKSCNKYMYHIYDIIWSFLNWCYIY